jgi:hypothetical protein
LASVTISSDFIAHVHSIFWRAIDTVKYGHVSREGMNIFTSNASPAYICCVAAVEAFVNEVFFGLPTFLELEQGPLGSVERGWLERLDLRHKLVLFPQLLIGKTFDRGGQPYQDMSNLIRLRNKLVHYKMENTAPPYLRDLESRGIALVSDTEGADYIWVHKISCTEGIRWANNTSARTVHKLVEMIRDDAAVPSFLSIAENFREIGGEQVRDRIRSIEAGNHNEAP